MSRPVTAEEFLLLNETLRGAASVGAPLPEGLEALARDLGRPRGRETVQAVAEDLKNGIPLSEALARRPGAFPPVYLRLLESGEKSGSLEAVLRRVAAVERETLRLNGELREAMVYPLVICLVALGIVAVFSLWIHPLFAGMTMDWDWGKPSWLAANAVWLMLLPLLPMLVAACFILRPRRSGTFLSLQEERWARWIPLVGGLIKALSASRFCHAAGLLLERGVPAPEAITLAAEASGSARIAEQAPVARGVSEEGGTFADALPALHALPDTVLWICRHGERRGDLAGALEQMSRLYLDAAFRRMRMLKSLAAPAFVLLTLPVAFVSVWTAFQPLLHMMSALSDSGS